MSKDTPKADQADTAGQKSPPPAQTIPVKSLRFRPGFNLDMPGNPASSGIVAADPSASPYFRIMLIPALRCFRVEFYAGGADVKRAPTAIRHVHESWASWEPMS
jgi:hypothetical protein